MLKQPSTDRHDTDTINIHAHIFIRSFLTSTQVGYSPIGFVRCGRSACRMQKINWKVGKETGGKKMEEPHALKVSACFFRCCLLS